MTSGARGDGWDALTDWQFVLPPNRPGRSVLEAAAAWIEPLPRDCRVAVLGSTPEFRDLLGRAGFTRVTVIDRSTQYHACVNEQRLVVRSDEEIIFADWEQALPGLTGQFDLILSDLTLGNIPFERQAHFLSDVVDALAPGGLFVDRLLLHPRYKSLEELVPKFATLPFNLETLNWFNSDFLFTSELVADAGRVDSTKFIERLSRDDMPPHIRLLASRVHLITPRNQIWWYGLDPQQVASMYAPGATLIRWHPEPADSPYRGFAVLLCTMRPVVGFSEAAPLSGLLPSILDRRPSWD